MDQELRRFLRDFYSDFWFKQALALLYRDHGMEMRFKDTSRAEYRTDEELKGLEDGIRTETERLAEQFVDELEASGFCTHTDLEQPQKQRMLKAILGAYEKRLVRVLG